MSVSKREPISSEPGGHVTGVSNLSSTYCGPTASASDSSSIFASHARTTPNPNRVSHATVLLLLLLLLLLLGCWLNRALDLMMVLCL